MQSAPSRQIERDERMWPLVIFRWARRPGPADYFAMFSDYERMFRRAQRFHVIHDTADSSILPGAEERAIIAELSREQQADAARWVVGNITVVPNRALHEVLSAVGWLVPPSSHWSMVDDLPEAVDRAVVALDREGLALPAALRSYQAQLRAHTA